jgi:Cupin-like domain
MNETTSRRVSRALDLAILPLTFVWWTAEYRWGLRVLPRRRRPNGLVSPIPSFPFRELGDLFERREPVILTDVGRRWPAFSSWTPESLAAALGAREVDVNTAALDDPDFLQSFFDQAKVRMPFARLVDLVFGRRASTSRYYMMAGGWGFLGDLAGDVNIPREVEGRRFLPAASGLWVGQNGNITALHYDTWHGFLGQIVGRKQVILFAPGESSNLYPDTPFGRRLASTRLPTLCLSADRRAFPKLDQAERFEAVLNPGELLYIPPYWWHYVESLDDAISLGFRYDTWWREAFHPGSFPVKYQIVWRPVARALWRTIARR